MTKSSHRRAPRARRLRTGAAPWPQSRSVSTANARPLDGRDCDVVVVGAGITGACVSYALSQAGRQVVLLDRQPVARGSTMASTALITHELDLPLHQLSRGIGEAATVRAWQRSQLAVDRLRDLVSREGIQCGWGERDSLYLAGTRYGRVALRREAELRQAHGLSGAFLPGRELRDRFGIDRTGALHCTGVAVADPVRLTVGILNAIRDLELHTDVEVASVHSDGSRPRLDTSRGTVRAERVVFCTGYALLEGLPTAGLRVASTWVIATSAATRYPAWLDSTIVWEASDPYLYVRTLPGGRLIVGGRDELGAECHKDADRLPIKAKGLAADARKLFGLRELEVERCWSGAFGSSESGLPMIGPVPGLPGCHVVAGFGGNGITHAVLAGVLISAALGGSPLPDSAMYHPSALPGEHDSVAD